MAFGFSSLINRVRTFFIDHYNVLFIHLDALQYRDPPVQKPGSEKYKKVGKSSYSQFNGQFLFAGLLFFWCFFDGNFFLEYEYTGLLPLISANATYHYYLNTPYIMFHQVTPPSMWWQTDMVLYSDTVAVTAAFATLTFHANFPPRYVFYVVNNGANVMLDGKVLKSEVSRRILRNSRLGRRALKMITFSFEFTIVYTYCYYHVFLTNRLYRVSLHSAWVWIFGYPLFFFYIAHICLGSMSFVVMSSRYIQMRQWALLAKFKSLNAILAARKMRIEMVGSKNNNQNNPISWHPIWRRYHDLNTELIDICLHIKAYARFWSSFLTLMFPYLIFVQCYLLYLAVIAEGIAFELTYIYKMGIAELMPLFFMLIGQCAKVVAINNRVLVENRRFFVAYSQLTLKRDGGAYQQFRVWQLMKAENFQIVRALHTYSFKVFTNYRITSKTFHSIIVYISLFFLYVYKE